MTDLQKENIADAVKMGIISHEEAVTLSRAIRDKDDEIIKGLYVKRALQNRNRAFEHTGA